MKNEKIMKVILPLLVGVLSIVGIVLVAFFMGMPDTKDMTDADKELYDGRIISGLWYTMIIIGIALGAIFIFFLANLAADFKKSGKLLIGLALFGVLGAICYFMAGGEVTDPMLKATDGDISEGTVRWVEAGLYLTFILTAIAVAVWVIWGAIARRIK